MFAYFRTKFCTRVLEKGERINFTNSPTAKRTLEKPTLNRVKQYEKIISKEKSVLTKKIVCLMERICWIDLNFFDHKNTIEVDEFCHCDRSIEYEKKRQKVIEEKLGCVCVYYN